MLQIAKTNKPIDKCLIVFWILDIYLTFAADSVKHFDFWQYLLQRDGVASRIHQFSFEIDSLSKSASKPLCPHLFASFPMQDAFGRQAIYSFNFL